MTNRNDGSRFFGCTRYPACSYTRNVGTSGTGTMKCPRCGAKLKELTNRKDGSVFYGCTRYPACKYTRNK